MIYGIIRWRNTIILYINILFCELSTDSQITNMENTRFNFALCGKSTVRWTVYARLTLNEAFALLVSHVMRSVAAVSAVTVTATWIWKFKVKWKEMMLFCDDGERDGRLCTTDKFVPKWIEWIRNIIGTFTVEWSLLVIFNLFEFVHFCCS